MEADGYNRELIRM